jgi:hypothetical protein
VTSDTLKARELRRALQEIVNEEKRTKKAEARKQNPGVGSQNDKAEATLTDFLFF